MKIAINSLLSILPNILTIIISLVTVPLYIDILGADRYGALLLAWLLLGYFGQADFGIGRAIAQRIGSMQSAERSAMADAVWSALFSVTGFSVMGGVLIYVVGHLFFGELFKLGPGLREEMVQAIPLLALCVPLVAISGVMSGALIGLQRFKLASLGNAFSICASQLLPLLVAYLYSPELKYLVGAALVGRFIGLVPIAIGAWQTFLRGESISPSKAEFRRLAGYGSWIMVTAFIGPFMTMSDRFVIGAVLGAAAVAAYSVPFQIATRTMVLPLGVIQALFPRMAAEAKDGSLDLSRKSALVIGQLYAPLILGLICLAAPLLKIWLGDHLDERSILIGQVILAGFWFNALANVPYAQIQARGNPRYTALLHLAELPVYFVMLYFLGREFGLPGVAAAFALRCAIDFIFLMRKAGLWTSQILLGLVPHASLILIALGGSYLLHNWPTGLAAAALLCSASLIFALLQMPEEVRRSLEGSPIGKYVFFWSKRSGAEAELQNDR